MIEILVNQDFQSFVDDQTLTETAQTVLTHLINAEEVDLCISIENDIALANLNEEYLGINAPTDVLSFELNELNPETGHLYLGDIIISFERVSEQSRKAGHTVQAEMQLMIIHGILHLLGHDHGDPDQKEKMWEIQKRMIDKLAIEIKQLPEE